VIAGLPAASWLLIVVAVGAGLAIELMFLRAHRRAPDAADRTASSDAARERQP
jgi:hypothetical protein